MSSTKPAYELSGIADEAGPSIAEQIRATKELGWTCIEARNIQGTNLTDISDEAFEDVEAALSAAGVRIDCFGSAVANWAKDPRSEEDFQKTLGELQRAIPRMKRLGTRQLRAMSFQAIKDARPDSMEIEELVVRKVKQLVAICADADILYLHENCANFGGLSWEHTLRLIERIDSPYFRLIFDTGNPVGTFDRRGKPWERQDSLEFFLRVKEFAERIHIKDARFIRPTDTIFNDLDHCWPGEGEGKVAEVLREALASGFKGTFSIEPHLAAVYHAPGGEPKQRDPYSTYVEYGRRTMTLLDKSRLASQAGSAML
jgi:sugar phosphate isomerase/epimerase